MKERIILTGGSGMLARTLRQMLADDYEVFALSHDELDISNPAQLADVAEKIKPSQLIHTAAMTAVDRCESESERAFRINSEGSVHVAQLCCERKIRLIAVSTDYVFDGIKTTPYLESDCADGGRTVYGRSKFAGEEAIRRICPEAVIARTAWLYGPGGPSFLHTMYRLAGERRPIRVVNDQFGNPTSVFAFGEALQTILSTPKLAGIFHLSCEGCCSWYDFAEEFFRQMQMTVDLAPCTSKEYPTPAPRPKNSCLAKTRLPMPCWQDALKKALPLLQF